MNGNTEKKMLRQDMMRLRAEIPLATRHAADEAICRAVLAHPAFAAAKQVFAYVAMPHEVRTQELLTACLDAGKNLALPVCNTVSHTMTFYRLDRMSELTTGAYRIPVPPVSDDRICNADSDTLVLLPMLAFDAEGYRLGAGGGYYDRFLAAHPDVKTIGLCYAYCGVEHLPHDEYDKKMQTLVTEKRTEDFHG